MDLETLEECEDLARDLEELQAKENDGRGVSCVRTLCVYLRRGDLRPAQALCHNEWDKIRNYPPLALQIFDGLEELLIRERLPGLEIDLSDLMASI